MSKEALEAALAASANDPREADILTARFMLCQMIGDAAAARETLANNVATANSADWMEWLASDARRFAKAELALSVARHLDIEAPWRDLDAAHDHISEAPAEALIGALVTVVSACRDDLLRNYGATGNAGFQTGVADARREAKSSFYREYHDFLKRLPWADYS